MDEETRRELIDERIFASHVGTLGGQGTSARVKENHIT